MALPAGDELEERDGFILYRGAWPEGLVARVATDDLERVREEARAWCRERGLERFAWHVRPELTDRVLAFGATRSDYGPLAAMLLVEEPPAVPDVETQRVASAADWLAWRELVWDAFGMPEAERVQKRATHDEDWAALDPDYRADFVALLDGEIVAAASVVFTPQGGILMSGNTRPDKRGRGAYRALVRARWNAVVERGTPALTTQANPNSRPILERNGFTEITTIDVLGDTV